MFSKTSLNVCCRQRNNASSSSFNDGKFMIHCCMRVPPFCLGLNNSTVQKEGPSFHFFFHLFPTALRLVSPSLREWVPPLLMRGLIFSALTHKHFTHTDNFFTEINSTPTMKPWGASSLLWF